MYIAINVSASLLLIAPYQEIISIKKKLISSLIFCHIKNILLTSIYIFLVSSPSDKYRPKILFMQEIFIFRFSFSHNKNYIMSDKLLYYYYYYY